MDSMALQFLGFYRLYVLQVLWFLQVLGFYRFLGSTVSRVLGFYRFCGSAGSMVLQSLKVFQ